MLYMSTCAVFRNLDFHSIGTGKPLKCYMVSTQWQDQISTSFFLGGGAVTDMSIYTKIDQLEWRMRAVSQKIITIIKTRVNMYIKNTIIKCFTLKLKFSLSMPWKNILWIQNNCFLVLLLVPKCEKCIAIIYIP